MRNQKNAAVTRIRFKFYKKNEFKYLSHLDIVRIIIRALNRAGFKVVYSHGYNPKPAIGFSPPTPLGIESMAEYADVFLYNDIAEDEFTAGINRELKQQIQVTGAVRISGKTENLMNEIGVSLYSFILDIGSSGKNLLKKFYAAVGGSLVEKSQFSGAIFNYEITPREGASDFILLKLYGYAKIFKEKDNEFFKFNDFYRFLSSRLGEYKIRIKSVKKEEQFALRKDKLKNPMEITQQAVKGE